MGGHALIKHCSRGGDSGGRGQEILSLTNEGRGGKWIQTLAFKNYKHSLVHKMLYGNCV